MYECAYCPYTPYEADTNAYAVYDDTDTTECDVYDDTTIV